MSEMFDKPDPPWLAPNDRWRWLAFVRTSPGRAALLGAGLAVVVALAVGAAGNRPKAATTVAPSASAKAAVATAVAVSAQDAPVERVVMRQSAEARAEQQRPLARAADLALVRDLQPNTPEARLMNVYALMAEGQGQKALEAAQRLANDVPTFGLAQLVYADLLSGLTLGNPGFATYPPTLRDATPERLDDLTAEARARITSAGNRPPAGTVPSQFVFLGASVRHAIAVDVSKSRLYLFENTSAGPVLKRDYYASVGKLGISKQVEGDLRTPLGVYFITGSIPSRKLAERYGAGALPLNYPNHLDQMRGRTGSGIWVHGVEPANFTRAPLATDGCVAVSNPDLREISQWIDPNQTPVVIAEKLVWVEPSQASAQQADFMGRFNAWRVAHEAGSDDLLNSFYAAQASQPGDAPAAGGAIAQHVRDDHPRAAASAVAVKDMSVLAWKDEDEVMIVTYTEAKRRASQSHLKRQYWLRKGTDWSIVYEATIG